VRYPSLPGQGEWLAMMGGWMTGWMWIWPVLVVAGLLIIGYVVLRLVQGGRPSSPTGADPAGSTARRILDERYARGEIDEDEYLRRRGLLP
jgi:putative membrane protein